MYIPYRVHVLGGFGYVPSIPGPRLHEHEGMCRQKAIGQDHHLLPTGRLGSKERPLGKGGSEARNSSTALVTSSDALVGDK